MPDPTPDAAAIAPRQQAAGTPVGLGWPDQAPEHLPPMPSSAPGGAPDHGDAAEAGAPPGASVGLGWPAEQPVVPEDARA